MKSIFFQENPIIAVIYLAPQLGYPEHPGMEKMIDQAFIDLEVLKRCGVDGALLENEHDQPYHVLASPEVISSMTAVSTRLIQDNPDYPLGVEFLINDPKASLSIAKASGASFIRSDYFVDRMAREEYGGEMYINPGELNEFRSRIGGDDIAMFTDLQVKYATLLEEGKTLAESAKQAFEQGSSGAVISSHMTGVPPGREELMLAREGAPELPILIGSGLALDNLERIFPLCDGAIVGSALMTDTRMDYEKVAPFMDKVRQMRG